MKLSLQVNQINQINSSYKSDGFDGLDELQTIWAVLAQLPDPEIPVLTLMDLGIIRDVKLIGNQSVSISITPTYSGCPAREVIAQSIVIALENIGLTVSMVEQLSPAWTTDWMSESGKTKLKEYGIAPPQCTTKGHKNTSLADEKVIQLLPYKPECPRCDSQHTALVSAFGSTACKALYRCLDCLEPFDYFKKI